MGEVDARDRLAAGGGGLLTAASVVAGWAGDALDERAREANRPALKSLSEIAEGLVKLHEKEDAREEGRAAGQRDVYAELCRNGTLKPEDLRCVSLSSPPSSR